jgi:hypothetical protein
MVNNHKENEEIHWKNIEERTNSKDAGESRDWIKPDKIVSNIFLLTSFLPI